MTDRPKQSLLQMLSYYNQMPSWEKFKFGKVELGVPTAFHVAHENVANIS
jgi:hypothetical protein